MAEFRTDPGDRSVSARLALLPVITPGPYAEALPGLAVTCGRDWTA